MRAWKMGQIGVLWVLMISYAAAQDRLREAEYNKIYCARLGGKTEVKHSYITAAGESGYVIIDCETKSEVIEGGLDKRTSLDSLQQALFFHYLTGKKPIIVIYDTDGCEGKIEYRIRQTHTLTPAEYRNIGLPASHDIWSGRRDLNSRPSGPKPDALPDCATPR